MDDGGLERIREVLGRDALADLSALDLSNDLHLDRAASALLKQFRDGDDGAAFALLVELVSDRLAAIAQGIAVDLGMGTDPHELVTNFFSRLFVDTSPRRASAVQFLASAAKTLEQDAEAIIRELAMGEVPDPEEPTVLTAGPQSVSRSHIEAMVARAARIGFHRLDQNDRRVLRAKDVEGLGAAEIAARQGSSYLEVEALLQAARVRLARSIDDVLKGPSTRVMTRQTLMRKARGDQRNLGLIAYRMARSCLAHVERTDVSIRYLEEPLCVEDLARDLRQAAERTEQVFDRLNLPRATPSSASAVKDARACLDFALSLEGRTPRVRYTESLIFQAEGDVGETGRSLTSMLVLPLSQKWANYAKENLQTVYISERRFEEVVDLGHTVLRRSPGRLSTLFNMATAYAWLGKSRQFFDCCAQFRNSTEVHSDHAWWSLLIDDEADWFAKKLGRDPDSIREAFARPVPPGWVA